MLFATLATRNQPLLYPAGPMPEINTGLTDREPVRDRGRDRDNPHTQVACYARAADIGVDARRTAQCARVVEAGAEQG